MSRVCNAGTKKIMTHSERQKFLKTSGLAKLFGVDHLLPEVEEIDTWNPVPPKNSINLTMKAQYKGRKKPMKYVLDNENE